jgi:hypothetical protein
MATQNPLKNLETAVKTINDVDLDKLMRKNLGEESLEEVFNLLTWYFLI